MLEENNQNGFLTDDNDLDLGSDLGSGDFADFVSIDDDLDGIFDDAPKPEPTIPEAAPKQEPEEQSAPVDLPQEAEDPEPKAMPKPVDAGEADKDSLEEAGNAEKTDAPKAAVSAKAENEADGGESADAPNIFDTVMAAAEEKQAEKLRNSLAEKLPIFSFSGAEEEIEDPSKTFDQLRQEKTGDFSSLDSAKNVSWKVTYGSVSKAVGSPAKTTIASVKAEIENSKKFLDYLKKAKGEIKCKVTPFVSTESKGIVSAYKGIYTSMEEAQNSGKVITFVPSDNGKVYEIRFNKMGAFIAPSNKVTIANRVRAGFIPALPKIPYELLSQVVAFFKAYVTKDEQLEAAADIYWDLEKRQYFVNVPEQEVSKDELTMTIPDMDEEKYLRVMELHSHNTMAARFSEEDNENEKETHLYTVIGRMDKVFPDMATRIFVGGKYIEVQPETVFEGIAGEFPSEWKNAVKREEPCKKEAV